MIGRNRRTILWFGILSVVIITVTSFWLLSARQKTQFNSATIPNDIEIPSSAPSGAEDGNGLRYVVPGTSPINSAGLVLADPESKEVTLNNVLPGSPPAPLVSDPLNMEDLSQEVARIELSEGNISPDKLEVSVGEALTLAISATDASRHVFRFEDPSLAAINVSLQPGETRAITFNAPSEPGEYAFFCDIPGHAARGERGIMLVQ